MSRRAPSRPRRQPKRHAPIFAALGDETRLALVTRLSAGETHSIAQLTKGSRLTRQAITKHLRVLQDVGLVRNIRSGRESLFELDQTPLSEIKEYLNHISEQSNKPYRG